MRWDKLFDDLETQLERELTAEEIDLGAEEERTRLGRLTLRDRIASIHARDAAAVLAVTLITGQRLRVRPDALGRDWISCRPDEAPASRGRCILRLDAIETIGLRAEQVRGSLAVGAEDAVAPLSHRLGIAFVLRDLCRRRKNLDVVVASGTSIHGTIDRIGRDHFDLAMHEAGTPRRDSSVVEHRMVSLESLVAVWY